MFDLWDRFGIAGLVLLTIGGGLAWPPLYLIVPGAALCFIGWRGSLNKGSQ